MTEPTFAPGDRVRAKTDKGPTTRQVVIIGDKVMCASPAARVEIDPSELVLVATERQHLENITAASAALEEAQAQARAIVEAASAAYGAVARGEYV
jgi:hypothetical protein